MMRWTEPSAYPKLQELLTLGCVPIHRPYIGDGDERRGRSVAWRDPGRSYRTNTADCNLGLLWPPYGTHLRDSPPSASGRKVRCLAHANQSEFQECESHASRGPMSRGRGPSLGGSVASIGFRPFRGARFSSLGRPLAVRRPLPASPALSSRATPIACLIRSVAVLPEAPGKQVGA